MRTFIAIELPKEIRDSLMRLQERLKLSDADVKWVAPQNIHLTLKFLGEIEDNKLLEISKAMEEAAGGKPAFDIRISSLGAFPKIDFPRVIWVGIVSGDKETKEIAKVLEDRLSRIGIPKEDRPFSSHITIGRTRSNLNRDKLARQLKANMDIIDQDGLQFNAKNITLFKSTLTPKGPIYEVLKEVSLTST